MTNDDQVEKMQVLVTSTPSLEEKMQELQRKLAEKDAETANLVTHLENREREKANQVSSSNIVITSQYIKKLDSSGN